MSPRVRSPLVRLDGCARRAVEEIDGSRRAQETEDDSQRLTSTPGSRDTAGERPRDGNRVLIRSARFIVMAARSLTRLWSRSVSSSAEAHRLARAPAQPSANPLARFQPVDSSPVTPEPDAAHLGEADVLERTAEGALISNGPLARHVAVPKTAHGVPGQIEAADADLTSSAAQAPDRRDVWSQGQNPRSAEDSRTALTSAEPTPCAGPDSSSSTCDSPFGLHHAP